jgi:hypothetical protein
MTKDQRFYPFSKKKRILENEIHLVKGIMGLQAPSDVDARDKLMAEAGLTKMKIILG